MKPWDVVDDMPTMTVDCSALRRIREMCPLPKIARSGEYRNRFGERVTWEASEDGSYIAAHTWPEPPTDAES